MTRYELHVSSWRDCTQCELHEHRKRVVLARGDIPADIVFTGEAPGQSEDVLGRPFVGPAGKLLDYIVKEAMPLEYADGEYNPPTGPKYTTAFTNLVACIPLDEDHIKTAEPSRDCIKACELRLVEFVRLCQPKLIVLVGALAKKHIMGQAMFSEHEDYSLEWIDDGKYLHFVEITHPAAVLRSNIAQQGLAIQRCIVKLKNAIHECFEVPSLFDKPASRQLPKPGSRR